MVNQCLFDSFERCDMDGFESEYDFRNRSARDGMEYFRDLIQGWFDNFQPDDTKRRELLSKFRSKDDRQHFGALFELYLHQLFMKLGYEVEVEPDIADVDGKPDFLLETRSGQQILVEAITKPPEYRYGAIAREKDHIFRYIENNLYLPFDFAVTIWFTQASNTTPSHNRIVNDLQHIINQLAPTDKIDTFRRFEEWEIRLIVFPLPGHKLINRMRDLPPEKHPVRDAIKDKGNKYSKLNIPYIVTVYIDDFPLTYEDVRHELVGYEFADYVSSASLDEPIISFKNDSKASWNNTRNVSALFLISNYLLQVSAIAGTHTTPILWHNHNARNPIEPEIWTLSQAVWDKNTNHFKIRKGDDLFSVLKIDPSMLPGRKT